MYVVDRMKPFGYVYELKQQNHILMEFYIYIYVINNIYQCV